MADNERIIENDNGEEVVTTSGVRHAAKGTKLVWSSNPNIVDIVENDSANDDDKSEEDNQPKDEDNQPKDEDNQPKPVPTKSTAPRK